MRLGNQNNAYTTKGRGLNGTGYWWYLGLLCLILFLRDVVGVGVPLPVFLVYFAVAYLVMDYDHSLALTAMLPLLNHGVQTNYIIFMALFTYFYKYGNGFRLNIVHGIVALLMIWELFHMAYQPFSMSEYLRYLVQYMYLAVILGEDRLRKLLKNPMIVLYTFIFVAAYFMLDVLLVTLRYVPMETMLAGEFRFGVLDEFFYRAVSLNDNENMVGMFALMALGFAVLCMMKQKKYYVPHILIICYFTFFGFLTQSKTFLICILLMGVLFGWYYLRQNKRNWGRAFLGVIAAASVIFVVLRLVFPEILTGVLKRFQAEDLGTGRTGLMEQYNDVITKNFANFFFGIGLQSVVPKTGIWNAPHNGFQEAWVCWGAVGLLLTICLVISAFRRPRQYAGRKCSFYFYIPMIAYVAVIQTMQMVRMPSVVNMLIPLFIAAYMGGVPDATEEVPNHSRHGG